MGISSDKLIGHWQCPDCGEQCEVGQAARRGHHFYTNCGQERCGINQGTGAGRQNRIWREAQFLSGVTVKRPANVTEDGQPRPVNEPAPEPAGEPKPTEQASEAAPFDPDSVTEGEPGRTGAGAGRVLGAAVVLASIVGGVLLK